MNSPACVPTKNPGQWTGAFDNKSGNDLLSHTLARVVPSALKGLTAEFGMGSGVTPSLWSPEFSILTDRKSDTDVLCCTDLIEAPGFSVINNIMVKSHDRLVPLD